MRARETDSPAGRLLTKSASSMLDTSEPYLVDREAFLANDEIRATDEEDDLFSSYSTTITAFIS